MALTLERYTTRHPHLTHAAPVMALFGLAILGGVLSPPGAEQPHSLLPHTGLSVVACVVLLGHRRHPRAVAVVAVGCTAAASALGYLLNPLMMAPAMGALYWLAALTDRRTARRCLLGSITLVAASTMFLDPHSYPLIFKTVNPAFWMLLPVAAGTAARMRQAYLEAMRARAEHAERTREEEARLRVAEERMRIARDLHDVVAHHLALAHAQAGTAAHLARTRSDQVEEILTGLTGTTAEALRELKATVGLLRQADDTDDPLQPAPGLARLPELTAACRAAGVEVTVATEGEAPVISPAADLTAFRIVQEALTNVSKHAAAKAAHVRLSYAPDRLTVTVTDDGTGKSPAARVPGYGYGLMGMRERAHSVGGTLRAGHRAEGGFEVTATLPLHPRAPGADGSAPARSGGLQTSPPSGPGTPRPRAFQAPRPGAPRTPQSDVPQAPPPGNPPPPQADAPQAPPPGNPPPPQADAPQAPPPGNPRTPPPNTPQAPPPDASRTSPSDDPQAPRPEDRCA